MTPPRLRITAKAARSISCRARTSPAARGDARQDVLKLADGIFCLRVFLSTGQDSAEGAATPGRHGTPAQHRLQRVDCTGEKPGQLPVRAGQGNRQGGECSPQVFQPVDLRQPLLDIRRLDGFAQPGLGLQSQGAVTRRQFPHPRQILHAHEFHHNTHRPHMSLSGAAPLKPLPPDLIDLDAFRVRRIRRAGGVINEYRTVT